MHFGYLLARDWETPLNTIVRIFSLLTLVLVLPIRIEAKDYHIRASDGEVYRVIVGENSGVKNFSVQNSKGEMLRGVTEAERVTVAELYFAAKVFWQILPLYSPPGPLADVEAWVTDIATGAILKFLAQQGTAIPLDGAVKGFLRTVQLLLNGNRVETVGGWIPAAIHDGIRKDAELRFIIDAANLAKALAATADTSENDLRAFSVSIENREGILSMETITQAWVSFYTGVASKSLTTHWVHQYLQKSASDIDLSRGGLGSIAVSLLPAGKTVTTIADGIVITSGGIGDITDTLGTLRSVNYTPAHIENLRRIRENADSEIGQQVLSDINAKKSDVRAFLEQADYFQNTRANKVPDVMIREIMISGMPGVKEITVAPGETFQMEVRVWNRGRAVSSRTSLRYLLSRDATIVLGEDTEVDSSRVNPLSGRGASTRRRRADLSKSLTVPDTPGLYYYGVCIDQVEGETDIRNNVSQTIAVTVTTPSPAPADSQVPPPREIEGPDLVFTMTRVDQNIIKLGWGVKLHLTLTNQGTTASDSTWLRFYRSENPIISPEDTEIHAVRISQLGAGRNMTTWAPLLGPTSLGTYYYGVCVDAVPSEVDTMNNCAAAFEITVEPQSGGTPVLVPVGTIPTQVLGIEGAPKVIDIADNFLGNVERYRASSNAQQIVSVDMSTSEVTLTPRDKGWARVDVTAFSGDLAAKHSFFVSVGGVAPPNSEHSQQVSIPDANLRVAVREALTFQNDTPLTQLLMAELTQLDAGARKIKDLTGLEYAVSLADLTLSKNREIVDLTPLQNLTRLTRLALDMNKIIDLQPLENLKNLTDLSLEDNRIREISVLRNLIHLTDVSLVGNQIRDVSPLEGLMDLEKLRVSGNPIADFAPLRRLKQRHPSLLIDIDLGGQAPSIPMSPPQTALLSNYPNPFNPETWIPYELATDTDVRLTIYNTQGTVIRTLQVGQQSAGYYIGRDRAAYWDGRNALGEQVASGIYFYQLETDEMSTLRKMVILK